MILEKYFSLGFHMLPLYGIRNKHCLCRKAKGCPTPGKHPSIKNGLNASTNKLEEIEKLLRSRTTPNLGIRTGEISNLLVVDIDPRHNGYESIKKLKVSWPETPVSITGSLGEHRLFKYPKGIYVPSFSGLLEGVDIRAQQGYIVAPPSVHVTGNSYKWDEHMNLDTVEIAETPNWLLELILERQEKESSVNTDWQDMTDKTVSEGNRNNHILKLSGHLIGKNVDIRVCFNLLSAINQTKCQPPLETGELIKILDFVAKKHFERNRRYGKRYSTFG